MKKVYSTILMLSMTIGVLNLCSCGGNDDDSGSTDMVYAAYKKVQNSIVGTWVMESYYEENLSESPYLKFGWNDSRIYENEEKYQYAFDANGKVTCNFGKTYSYSLVLDENKIPEYIEAKSRDSWPYSRGVIYLKIGNEVSPFYAEIKSDGMLYLYNSTTNGGDGRPKFRYKKQ